MSDIKMVGLQPGGKVVEEEEDDDLPMPVYLEALKIASKMLESGGEEGRIVGGKLTILAGNLQVMKRWEELYNLAEGENEGLRADEPEFGVKTEVEEEDEAIQEGPSPAKSLSPSPKKKTLAKTRAGAKRLTGPESFDCDRCGDNLVSQKSLIRHKKEVHPQGMKGYYACKFCHKRFSRKKRQSWLDHLNAHTKTEAVYKCDICTRVLSSRVTLQKHLLIHDPNRKRNYKCTICTKACYTAGDLGKHMVTHKLDKPFKCPKCPKRFRILGHVNKHLVAHSDHTPFKCQFCPRRFKRQSQLMDHRRSHTGERPFVCGICKKSFKRSGHLSDHQLIHRGEDAKEHQCPWCPMKFFQKFNSEKHQQRRHKSEWAATQRQARSQK